MQKLVLSLVLLFGTIAAVRAEENTLSPTAVVDAARQFRILTYDQFRMNRAEYDARRAVADELMAAWNAAEQPSEHRTLVANWFAEAAALTVQNPTATLPPIPEVPRASKVSQTNLPLDSATPVKKRAYLDPEALRALDEVSGRVSGEDAKAAASTTSEPVSNILKGLKRVVLGDE